MERRSSAVAASTPRTLRFLCLHGFRTNKKIMEDQTRELRAALGSNVEYVFLNGPHVAEGDSDPMIEGRYKDFKPFHEWWCLPRYKGNHVEFGPEASAKAMKRAKEKDPNNEWYMYFQGIYETIEYVQDQIQKHGPFDVALGFSQGAVMLTVLTMWYLKHQRPVPWKLSMCVGGMRVHGSNVRSLFEMEPGVEIPVPMPSIHVIGREDPLFTENHKLAQSYGSRETIPRLIVEHDTGHRFPSMRRNPEAYEAILRAIQTQFPGFGIVQAAGL